MERGSAILFPSTRKSARASHAATNGTTRTTARQLTKSGARALFAHGECNGDFSPIWVRFSCWDTLLTGMQEAAKVRRGELIQEIKRYRGLLPTVEFTRFTSSEQEFAKHKREITEKL